MKTAIIIHGMPGEKEFFDSNTPSPSNFQFLPWLQKQLSIKGVIAQTPEMPTPYNPVYKEWKEVFEQFTVTGDTLLVGHSCGGGFLARWLSENKIKVGKVILIEPWIDIERELKTGMFEFEIDGSFPQRTDRTVVMYGEDCHADIKMSIDKLKEKVTGADFQEIPGTKNHFCSPTLPEILPELN